MEKQMIKISIFVSGIFVCMLDTTVMNIALPQISQSFSTSLDNLSWAINIYTILFASLTIPLTRIAEKWGMNKSILFGFLLLGSGSCLSGMANALPMLLIGRAIQSIGAALVFPLSMTLGIEQVKQDSRTGMIALLGVTQGLAAALGPIIGGVITQLFSWRWIFLINVPIIILILFTGRFVLNLHEATGQNKHFDIAGSITSIIFLVSLTLVLTQGRILGWTSVASVGTMIVALLVFVVFIIIEKRTMQPMIPLELFTNRQFNGAAIVIVLSNLFLVAITVILPTYYTTVAHFDALHAALMLLPITIFIFIMSPIAGFSLKKIGAKQLITLGFLLMALGYLGFGYNGLENQLYAYLDGALIGAGYGLITGPITILAASDFTGELLSASQSVAGVMRQVGTVLAVSIFVTSLYSNIDNAQKQSNQYMEQSIGALPVPNQIKSVLIDKSRQALKDNNQTQQIPKKHTGDKKIDVRINMTLIKIKKEAEANMMKAFKNLYKSALPFLILSAFCTLLFWKNQKISE